MPSGGILKRWRLAAVVGAVALAALAVSLVRPPAPETVARAEFEARCMECHSPAEQSGGLVLTPATFGSPADHTETWEKVLGKIRIRAMPPPDQPRPDEAGYRLIQEYLETELDRHAAAHPDPGQIPRFRRLTRTEYGNAIRDLLAIEDLPAELDFELLLPADNSSSGFDNIAELLFVSPAIMERYLDAATKVSRLAVGDMTLAPLVNLHQMSLQSPQDTHVPGLPIGTRGGLRVSSYFPLDAEYVIAVSPGGIVTDAHELDVLIDGAPTARFAIGPDSASGPLELRVMGRAGPVEIGVTFVERTQAADESLVRARSRGRGTLPYVDTLTISGPYAATGPGNTPSRERIFVCYPERDAEQRACASEILSGLARRAYRRPVAADELGELLAFYEAGLEQGGFDLGIQRALERLLISPRFLYRIEQDPQDAAPGAVFAISDLELAARLSFFLWSSIPDDELLTLAIDGQLRAPGVLESQVRRMLSDRRSDSLVTNFATQWLFLRDIGNRRPDLFLFRHFDDSLRSAYRREIELFVGSVFRHGASILELLTAHHTYVNERLAEHYGIANVLGSHFRRVELPEGSPRAGLLGKGGILTLTSYSTRTSPVLRGKYVLDNLLATPPPAPPPDVPSLATEDEADGAPLTMREALARHREDPACAGCHYEMDAIGFALENFDATGRWRDADAGGPIDAASELPDGTPIDGVVGLRSQLSTDPERFAHAFSEKLLMYAIGRNVQYHDAPAVRTVVRAARDDGYSFASIVTGIVTSVPFQMRKAGVEGSP